MADVFPEVGQVVLTSLLSLGAMFIFTRAGGKRQIAQMSPFDYLNAVTVGSIGAEPSVPAALTQTQSGSAVVLYSCGAANRVVPRKHNSLRPCIGAWAVIFCGGPCIAILWIGEQHLCNGPD